MLVRVGWSIKILDGGDIIGLVHPRLYRLQDVTGHKVGLVFWKNNDDSAICIGLEEISKGIIKSRIGDTTDNDAEHIAERALSETFQGWVIVW